MKEYPILFRTTMVQTILEGRKTMTRRLVKRTPLEWIDGAGFTPEFVALPDNHLCPYGYEGDDLWVRETWRPTMNSMPTGWPYDFRATAKEDGVPEEGPWKASIHMPRKVCRILLHNYGVRIERLQDITEEDAESEGVKLIPYVEGYRGAFEELWKDIHGKGSWDLNPWLWVIKFAKHERDTNP
jgi:hypothetical protein